VHACGLQADVPWHLMEGDTLVVEVGCLNATFDGELQATGLPGAEWHGRELRWVAELDAAGSYTLTLSDDTKTATADIFVEDNSLHADNEPLTAPADYAHEDGLSVVHISTDSTDELSRWAEIPCSVHIEGELYEDLLCRYRGVSSLHYPKKSYQLAFEGDSYKGGAFGDFERERLLLTTMFDDVSAVRQRFMYQMLNQSLLGPQVQTQMVVVYLNGVYQGLYMMSDKINDELLEAYGVEEPEVYKAVTGEATFMEEHISAIPTAYEKKESSNDDEQDFESLEEFHEWIHDASDAEFESQLMQKLDVDEYLDWWILMAMGLCEDSFTKNFYFYRDEEDGDPRWHVLGWDFNASLGQNWRTTRIVVIRAPSWYSSRQGLIGRMMTFDSFRQRAAERMERFNTGLGELSALETRLDALAAETSSASEKDWARWEGEFRSFENWSDRADIVGPTDEVENVRDFLIRMDATRWLPEDLQ